MEHLDHQNLSNGDLLKDHRINHWSRRRFLSVLAATGGGLTLAPLGWEQRVRAFQTPPAATPEATPVAEIPRTLPGDASPELEAVAARVLAAMAEYQVPGAALGIFANGREEHAVFGVENTETGTPVGEATRFQIGSVTKPYTGTAAMRLIGQGRLDLDATVRTYLPELRTKQEDVAARVTVRQLLMHAAGWWGDDYATLPDGDDALARFAAERLPTFPQLFPPGAFFSYNNAGFILLGRVIEVVTGKPYRAAIQELLLDPLGLTESTFDPAVVERRPFATAYVNGPDGPEVIEPRYFPQHIDPAGGLWSTTRDQLRFARFHLGDGTAPDGSRLLASHTLALMQTPQLPVPGFPGLAMGLDWFVQELPEARLLVHNGDTLGQHTTLVFLPDRQFALVLLTNAGQGGNLLEQAVVNEALQRYLGFGRGAAAAGLVGAFLAPAGIPTITVNDATLAEYAGRYAVPNAELVARVEDGQLLVSSKEIALPDQITPSVVAPPAPETPAPFVAADLALLPPILTPFVRRPDGEIGFVGQGLRLIPRVEPPPGA